MRLQAAVRRVLRRMRRTAGGTPTLPGSATLQSIAAEACPGEGSQGARPVAEFWHAYDAHHAAGKK